MKNKIAIASAFLAATSFSMGEIVVNEFLSFEGFVDSSYSHTNSDEDAGGQESNNSFQVDQVEISWMFNFDVVTAQIDLEYEDGDNEGGDIYDDEVEQAFVNYALGNGDVITAGRYASMLGFEAFEPTGLYQYSTAYTINDVSGNSTVPQGFQGISEYVQGVKFTRTSDTTFFGISLQDQSFGNNGGRLGGDRNDGVGDDDDDSSYAVEVAYSIDLGNGFNLFAGAAFEDADSGDNELFNFYATYETGAWLFAAELNIGENESETGAEDDTDLTSGLVMANYAYSDVASVTARISMVEIEQDTLDYDFIKYTVAHNYALADNLLLVTEISVGDLEDTAGNDYDVTELAVELLFSF